MFIFQIDLPYFVGMRPILMFGSIRSVAEGLWTPRKFTDIRLLPGMGSNVSLQILQPTVGFIASLELKQLICKVHKAQIRNKVTNRGGGVRELGCRGQE